jgi:hypothetical protein
MVSSSETEQICARCHRWIAKGVPEATLAQGIARCTIYNRPQAWNEPFCVLYQGEQQRTRRDAREGWITEFTVAQQAKEQQKDEHQPT